MKPYEVQNAGHFTFPFLFFSFSENNYTSFLHLLREQLHFFSSASPAIMELKEVGKQRQRTVSLKIGVSIVPFGMEISLPHVLRFRTTHGGNLEGRIQNFWNSLSDDRKKEILRVRVSDLKSHFSSVNNDQAKAALSEALDYLQTNHSWRFMECCVCEDKFTDLPLYVEHFARKHAGGDLSQGLSAVLSQENDICGITKFPEKDEALAGAQKSEIKETIHFSTDSSYLLLDERLLTGELDVITSNNSISNEGSASTFTLDDDKLPGSGRFVPWLFEGGSIEKTLALWTPLSEDRKHEKIEVHDFFKKVFSDLEMLCTMRSEFLAADEGLMRISSAADQYIASLRVASTQYSQQFMSTHPEELEAADAIMATLSTLSNVIEGAGDSKKEIRMYEMHIAILLHAIDAMINRDLAAMWREGFKLGEASARAFRSIVAISLKSYIRTLLQDLVDKDATEKASAAEAPSLEDLSLDAKKSGVSPLDAEKSGVGPLDAEKSGVGPLDAKKSGVGLENYHNDCSLNAIIQSLWHLRRFRRELMETTEHKHELDHASCVYCSLRIIFSWLLFESMSQQKKAVSPASLRKALSNLDPERKVYREGEMNDASEILSIILEALHQSFSTKKEESKNSCWGNLDCTSDDCITHSLFGIKILERVACHHCGCNSRQNAYNSLFHLINASELRKKKITHMDSSFDKLLKLVKMDDQFTCNPDEGGCGELNSIDQILSIHPYLFVVNLGWQNVRENADDLSATLAVLTTEIDIAVIYNGLDEGRKHQLIAMVCFHSRHLTCFAYDHVHKNWVHYNDKIVEVIGRWNDVVTKCERGNFQPQLLFYEAPLDE